MQATKEENIQEQKQECPGVAKAQAEHGWLQKLVGEWSGEGEATMGPGQPPVQWTCQEVVRSLGDLWIVAEGTGNMPGGGTAHTAMTLGFDPVKGRYVGTFVGSMMTHMWVYEGERDATGNVLTLNTEGPGMSKEAGYSKYQDVIEIKADDLRTLTSVIQDANGEWHQVVKATYRRTP
jgi:hypothetical protein